MSEDVRSVHLEVRVETNKGTYALTSDDLDLTQLEDAVRDFVVGLDF